MNPMSTTADFVIFPALDLRRGRCVRLRQGDPTAETVFGDDPAALARHWVSLGATWLHVVNLDGALAADAPAATRSNADLPLNLRRLAEIRAAVTAPIQFGGGLRTLADIELALELGATRVVLGTAAVQNPALVADALRRFGPAAIVVGIDARAGLVATHGWRQTSQTPALALAQSMQAIGVTHIVYTDIGRDGMLSGVDAAGAAALARGSGLQVIASGGVRDLADIRSLLALAADGIAGVIAGQALYTGHLSLPAARALVHETAPQFNRSVVSC